MIQSNLFFIQVRKLITVEAWFTYCFVREIKYRLKLVKWAIIMGQMKLHGLSADWGSTCVVCLRTGRLR